MMNFEHLLATRTQAMGVNVIREILKVVSQPGMISLAGGIPSPDSFPMARMRELTERVLEKYQSRAFQYDLTEGFIPLREALVDFFHHKNITASVDDITIQSGSQGVLDALGRVLISPGDKVAVEAPTYLAAIQAFRAYEAEFVRLEMDDDGLIPESLEEVLRTQKVKFVYVIPTFQNPTGRSVTLERRQQIGEIVQTYQTLLIEDDPYSALRYRGDALPAIKTFAPENTVYVTTLSKVLAPGLRIGICVAPPLIKKWMTIVKQGVDLHTSTFNQAIAAEYISGGYLAEQLPKIIQLYRPKQEAMLDALERYFPEDFTWSKPEGGMFIWAEGPEELDMEKLHWKAIERKVAYVPGKFFYSQAGEGNSTMRLNFTMVDEATIERAIQILGDVFKQER